MKPKLQKLRAISGGMHHDIPGKRRYSFLLFGPFRFNALFIGGGGFKPIDDHWLQGGMGSIMRWQIMLMGWKYQKNQQ